MQLSAEEEGEGEGGEEEEIDSVLFIYLSVFCSDFDLIGVKRKKRDMSSSPQKWMAFLDDGILDDPPQPNSLYWCGFNEQADLRCFSSFFICACVAPNYVYYAISSKFA